MRVWRRVGDGGKGCGKGLKRKKTKRSSVGQELSYYGVGLVWGKRDGMWGGGDDVHAK